MTRDESVAAVVDDCVRRFEEAGATGPLRDYLPPAGEPGRAEALAELIRVEMEYRWRAGRPLSASRAVAEWPELAGRADLLAAVTFEAERLREATPPPPGQLTPSEANLPPTESPDAPSPPALPEAGEEFAGFQLLAEMGRGAFGRVFRAEQVALANRVVALKVTAALTAEPETLARLQHPHVVPVYSVHKRGPLHALCMPLLGTVTLADVLRDLGRHPTRTGTGRDILSTLNKRSSTKPDVDLPPPPEPAAPAPALERLSRLSYVEAALWIVGRLADGLHHAHERGVVHRDVKPANVLLTDDGQPMLLDFNLAAPPGGVDGPVGGTPSYMAPEHLAAFAGGDGAVDARSDVYSLGLILYELLTGRAAFDVAPGRGAVDRLIAARKAGPPRLRRFNPAVTPAVEAMVQKCLAADPVDRYPSATALRDDVDRHLNHLPLLHAANPGIRESLRKWRRRHPRLTPALLGIGVVVAGSAAAFQGERLKRVEARERAREFRAARHAAEGALGSGVADPARLPAALDTATRALGDIGADADTAWADGPIARRLTASEADELRRDVGELQYLAARGFALRGDADGARRLNRLASATFRPGESPAVAAQSDELAGRVPPPPVDGDAREAYRRAADLAARRDFAAALPLAVRASEERPDLYPAWMVRGRALFGLGRDAEAETAFTVAAALEPESPWPLFERGRVRNQRGNFPGARADFDAVLARRPGDAPAHVYRAVARFSLKDARGAAADLTRAMELGATDPHVRLMRAKARRAFGDAAGADGDTAAGLAATPVSTAGWVARGIARAETDPAAALADFDAALRVDPDSPQALLNGAIVLSDRFARHADAAARLDRLLVKVPHNTSALSARAVVLARLGDWPRARAAAADALRADATPATWYQVAGAYARCSADDPADRATAFGLLERAIRAGYGRGMLGADPDLDELRGDPRFELMEGGVVGR